VQGFRQSEQRRGVFFPLKPFDERKTKDLSAAAIAGALNKKFGAIQDAVIFAVPPPPVQGLGNTGGFKLYLQDRSAHGYDELARVTRGPGKARQQPSSIRTQPIRRSRTACRSCSRTWTGSRPSAGVPLSNVFGTLRGVPGIGLRQ
jgi:multidrug efflux pump subunit AcrB